MNSQSETLPSFCSSCSGKVPTASLYDLTAIERDLAPWWQELNMIVGPLALTISIGCISLNLYLGFLFSLLGVAVMCSIMQGVRSRFSQRYQLLREMAKRDAKAAEALQFADQRFFSNVRYLSFLIGFSSIFLVALAHLIAIVASLSGTALWFVQLID